MTDSVSYDPVSGLADAATYKTSHQGFIDDVAVLSEDTELSSISYGYGGHLLQRAIESTAEKFELRSAELDVLGNQIGGLMGSEIIQMVDTDRAAAHPTGP